MRLPLIVSVMFRQGNRYHPSDSGRGIGTWPASGPFSIFVSAHAQLSISSTPRGLRIANEVAAAHAKNMENQAVDIVQSVRQ
jgi:hypothetical protein